MLKKLGEFFMRRASTKEALLAALREETKKVKCTGEARTVALIILKEHDEVHRDLWELNAAKMMMLKYMFIPVAAAGSLITLAMGHATELRRKLHAYIITDVDETSVTIRIR